MMLKDALLHQFDLSHTVITRNIDGISHDESIIRVGEEGGNINWILGHIISVRNPIMRFLGGTHFWSDEQRERFKQNSPVIVDAAQAVQLDELMQTFEQSQATLHELFEKSTEATFTADIDGHPAGMRIATLAFHEIYHAGQLGIMRRVIGHAGQI